MTAFTLGSLDWHPALEHPELLAGVVFDSLHGIDARVAAIDPRLADTASCAESYHIDLTQSANCVIIRGQRANAITTAAVLVRASDRADINGVIRRHLAARKASFLPLDQATALTSMEYGGITPIGLPADWPILIDTSVADTDWLVIGSGIRGSKLAARGPDLARLPGAEVLDLAAPLASN